MNNLVVPNHTNKTFNVRGEITCVCTEYGTSSIKINERESEYWLSERISHDILGRTVDITYKLVPVFDHLERWCTDIKIVKKRNL